MGEILCFDHITLSDRPLIVCDIDEVVLEFLTPFRNFLRAGGRNLLARSFRLHGNIIDMDSGNTVSDDLIKPLIEDFFLVQDVWQTPADQAKEVLASLSVDCDIVFLTAMPPRHTDIRRCLLDRHGFDYPLLSSEEPKGPIVRRLHEMRDVPLIFIDDIEQNLASVGNHAPDCLLIRLMANAEFRALAPPAADTISSAENWHDAARIIRAHLAR